MHVSPCKIICTYVGWIETMEPRDPLYPWQQPEQGQNPLEILV